MYCDAGNAGYFVLKQGKQIIIDYIVGTIATYRLPVPVMHISSSINTDDDSHGIL